jgi:hypothetical protein
MGISRRDVLVRTAGVGAAWAAMPFKLAWSASTDASTPLVANITCLIDGQAVGRQQVLAWEARRMQAVWRQLKPHVTSSAAHRLNSFSATSEVSNELMAQLRHELLNTKLQLGHQRIQEIYAEELALSKAVQQLLLLTSFGRYTVSVTDVQCNRGSAEGFVKWFSGRVQVNDEPAMLLACPDHHIIETQANGRQHVLETTGGSPLPTQFDIDYADAAGNPIALVAGLPHRMGGMALDGVRPIGYAFHQFGSQAGGGFRGRLSVAFPRSTPWFMVNGHRWHLACEFSNWIEAYLRC